MMYTDFSHFQDGRLLLQFYEEARPILTLTLAAARLRYYRGIRMVGAKAAAIAAFVANEGGQGWRELQKGRSCSNICVLSE